MPTSIPLWPDIPPHFNATDGFIPTLDLYLLDVDEPKGAVVVLPGGGYGGRADHEGGPIAEMFNDAGFHAFVAQYRVSPNRHPAPLLDAARALRLVRHNAAEWQIRKDQVAVLGFSAGGHLAASVSTLHAQVPSAEADDVEAEFCRPDLSILCYPVISYGEHRHSGSFNNLLGPDASEEEKQAMSLENRVDETTPPAFLWHTAEDGGVPVENSLLYATALSRYNTPFELHVYPYGQHGLGLAPELPHVATWAELSVEWLHEMGW